METPESIKAIMQRMASFRPWDGTRYDLSQPMLEWALLAAFNEGFKAGGKCATDSYEAALSKPTSKVTIDRLAMTDAELQNTLVAGSIGSENFEPRIAE